MVLTHALGRPRSPGRGFLLTVLTLGVYAPYWAVKAHMELFHQFELARERRQDGLGWLGAGVTIPVLFFVYLYHFASNVRYLEERSQLRRPLSAGGTVLMILLGMVSLGFFGGFVGPVMIQYGLENDGLEALVIGGIVVTALSVLSGLGLLIFAFVNWQTHINRVWRVYRTRMASRAT